MEAWKIEFLYGSNELYHYGTKGQKWGERHWQNDDGTFNAAGKERYFGKGTGENYKPIKKGSSGSSGTKSSSGSGGTKSSGESENKEKKSLTPEQKAKITKVAVGALAAAAVVGGTVYLAKTGKLDGVANAGKNLINKGKETVSKKTESLAQKKLDSKMATWTKNVQSQHDAAVSKVLGSSGSVKRLAFERNANMSEAERAAKAKKSAENTKKLLDKMYEEKINDPNVTKWTMTIDGITRSFDKTQT